MLHVEELHELFRIDVLLLQLDPFGAFLEQPETVYVPPEDVVIQHSAVRLGDHSREQLAAKRQPGISRESRPQDEQSGQRYPFERLLQASALSIHRRMWPPSLAPSLEDYRIGGRGHDRLCKESAAAGGNNPCGYSSADARSPP